MIEYVNILTLKPIFLIFTISLYYQNLLPKGPFYASKIFICEKGVLYSLQITLYDCLGPWETILVPKTFPQLKLAIFGLLVASLALKAFEIKNVAMAEFWDPKGP